MANLVEWIQGWIQDTPGESIIGIAIGEDFYSSARKCPEDKLGMVLPPEEALPLLDYEFLPDYNGHGCNPVYVWTQNYILAISEYDGSVGTVIIPRNPTMCKVDYI